MNILWLDCETRRPVVPKSGQVTFGVEYAESWTDYAGMGISVCCVMDSLGRASVYGQENISELQQTINYADKIVTYNGEAFDFPLLEAHGLIIPRAKSCDLHAKIQAATGKRVAMGDLAKRNLNAGKTGKGADAPIWWQESQRENDPLKIIKIVDYCLADVALTYRLWKLVKTQGFLLHPYNSERIYITL